MSKEDDAFWRLAAGLTRDAEQQGEARAIVAAGAAERSLADELRDLTPGDVVTVVAMDGVAICGRVLAVGSDYARVGEVGDALGSPRGRLVRTHAIRLSAIVRVTQEPGS